MAPTIYTDGSGGSESGFGYYIQETGHTFHEKKEGITSNQAEYHAILAVLKAADPAEPLVIYSDSKNTVSQLNHEFAINDNTLRNLAREAWPIMARFASLEIRWVPRAENPAGKMLGS
ncbi:ribonuclease HI [Cenarchaeum symbiosum A]|uniref:Ribonuclease HI n=1 Tax=Cenarchaeum symbiosum (strain A) TaxID=414004 RepID=A0RTL1_CENSY|nr:ribonuclease HI [Cenarchaeum symbiosum A]